MKKYQITEEPFLDTKMDITHEQIEICRYAVEVFGSCAKADHWLQCPLSFFGGKAPIDTLLHEPNGARRVGDILCRIEYGIFS